MVGLALVCSGMLCFAAPAATESIPDREAQRRTYESAAAEAGRDTAAHVKLALWCEAQGLTAERQKHLAIAILTDPANTVARGLMGLVKEGNLWTRPEDVTAKTQGDGALAATLADYNAKRAKTAATPDAQWKLALWCEERGLAAEAKAHFAMVVRLDPGRELAWKRLGYRKSAGRWRTVEQIREARAKREAREKADRHWIPLLAKARDDLRDPKKRGSAEAVLANVGAADAVPAVWRVFAGPLAVDQENAVRLFGQIDSAASSRALALFASAGASPLVRRGACETLRHRDPREYVGFLIDRLDGDPTPFEFGLVAQGDQLYRVLMREEPESYVVSVYDRPIGRLTDTFFGIQPAFFFSETWRRAMDPLLGTIRALDQNQQALLARDAQFSETTENEAMTDGMTLVARNARITERNKGVYEALGLTTGIALPDEREAWKAWYLDVLGYRYEKARKGMKPVLFAQRFSDSTPAYECFAAGTLVRTFSGPQRIETLKVGDRVLAQDTATGALSFPPVLAVYHNPPTETLRLEVDGDSITPSTLHRFWKAGEGWALARELKPGDTIRTLRGRSVIRAIHKDKVQPVYNLDVDTACTYFVGSAGALVHDNRMPELRAKGFDTAK